MDDKPTHFYPKGGDRIECLRRKSTILAPIEEDLKRLYERSKTLVPYSSKAFNEAEAQGGFLSDELSAVILNHVIEARPISTDATQVADIKKLISITKLFHTHMHDFYFMIIEGCYESLESADNLKNIDGLCPQIFINKVIRDCFKAANTLGRQFKRESRKEAVSILRDILRETLDYCAQNVLNAPLESYPAIERMIVSYPEDIARLLRDMVRDDIISIEQPGGMEYREAVAEMACKGGIGSVLDVGVGYGPLLVPLAARVRDVRGIDPHLHRRTYELSRFLKKEDHSITLEEISLKGCRHNVDAAIISGGEFLDDVEETARELSRVSKHRAVVGVGIIGPPIFAYAFRNKSVNAGSHTQNCSSYEPLRWKHELEKHFEKVIIHCYDQRRFILSAEK